MKTRTVLISFLSILFLSLSLSLTAQKPEKKSTEVVILHTNDMHARIDNFGKLAYLSDSLKKIHKYVFLVSAGDNFTGNPIVDMYPDKGFPMIELMNRLHFDVSAIGNHEFDLGQETLNKRREQATFPFISCNIDASGAVLNQPQPYTILKAGKVRIPFLGIIQLGQNGLPDSHPSRMEGVRFWKVNEKVKDFLWLKDKYGMLIGLTHLGVEGDEPLAQEYPQFDVIIGGHSHTTMTQPMMVNNVMIVQAGSGLKYVGKTTLTIEKKKITGRKYELISLSSIAKSDPEIQSLIDQYNNNPEMNKVVAVAETPFANEEELASMMTDAITSRFQVDFAFQNIGGVRISGLPAGDIKMKDIFRLDPFGNQVVTYTMTDSEIKSLICNAFNREKQIDLFCSGMSYTVILNPDGTCRDVEIKDRNGSPLDASVTYKVGMNSYIAASYKFDHTDPGTTNYNTSAQTLLEYLGVVKKVDYAGTRRTFISRND